MRAFPLLLAALALATPLDAETVRLRSQANGNIIEAEVVEVRAERLTFRLAGGERVYEVAWETLDLDWIRENSPAVWNERQLLLQPAEAPKPKEDPAADPFAKETPPADTKAILRNLAASLGDRAKGLSADRVESFCRHEAKVDEELFWKAYDELRRDGNPPAAGKADAKPSSTSRSGKDRGGKDRQEWQRDPALAAKEDALRQQQHQSKGDFALLTYLRALAEGGYRSRVAWHLLRFVPEDRQALVERLRKYEAQAAELAARAASPDARRDALVLRKQLADLAALLARVSRESGVQEERLKGDCAALLGKLAR